MFQRKASHQAQFPAFLRHEIKNGLERNTCANQPQRLTSRLWSSYSFLRPQTLLLAGLCKGSAPRASRFQERCPGQAQCWGAGAVACTALQGWENNLKSSPFFVHFQLNAINCSINLLLLIKSVIFFLLVPLQVSEQLFRQTQQAAFVKEECRRFLWLFSLSAYYVMLRTLPES